MAGSCLGEWFVKPSVQKVRAGGVYFVSRHSGNFEQELVVFRTDSDPKELGDPEAAGKVIGEIEPEELPLGGTAGPIYKLDARADVLLCNVSGHYPQGM